MIEATLAFFFISLWLSSKRHRLMFNFSSQKHLNNCSWSDRPDACLHHLRPHWLYGKWKLLCCLTPFDVTFLLTSWKIFSFPCSFPFWVMVHQHGASPIVLIVNHSSFCKKVLQSVSFQPFFSPSTSIFFSFKILKLKDMIHHDILKFVNKSLNDLSPSHFHNYLQLSYTVHSHEACLAASGDIFQSMRNTSLWSQGHKIF